MRTAPSDPNLGKDLESRQKEERTSLGQANVEFDKDLWFNYRMLQLFDILSLYFCCDGYADEKPREDLVAPIPVSYESNEEVKLRLIKSSLPLVNRLG